MISVSMAGLGTKNILDGMSRKSTAMSNNASEMGTPGIVEKKLKRAGSNVIM